MLSNQWACTSISRINKNYGDSALDLRLAAGEVQLSPQFQEVSTRAKRVETHRQRFRPAHFLQAVA
jgi:hypothetical protein